MLLSWNEKAEKYMLDSEGLKEKACISVCLQPCLSQHPYAHIITTKCEAKPLKTAWKGNISQVRIVQCIRL